MPGHVSPEVPGPVTVARRGRVEVKAVAGGTTAQPALQAPLPAGVPVPLADEPAPEAVNPVGQFRRCTFRRVDPVAPLPQRSALPVYEVMCLYVDREAPLSLGDLASARATCEACTATGIFRPDED